MNPMRIVAAGEAATGLALMLYPPLVVRLLFSADIDGAGLAMARIAGMALVALGVACWPGAITDGRDERRPRLAMGVYSGLAAVYLGVLGLDGALRGPLMWPAVVVHLVVTVLLARQWGPNHRRALRAKEEVHS
jgi:hypothetical protein